MMNYSSYLANRLREVFLHGTWIAHTNYKQELDNLDWIYATTKIQDLNTIAIMAQHVHYYIQGINEFFYGNELTIKDQFSFDFPPITSQNQWDNFLSQFWSDVEEFASQVEKMSESQLKASFVKEEYGSYFRNIDGMIEHAYYHLGQIILIKKLLIHPKK
jgi:hypothetical protein